MSDKDCPSCHGEGGFDVDGFDPSSPYGHTQHHETCQRCQGSGVIDIDDEYLEGLDEIDEIFTPTKERQ